MTKHDGLVEEIPVIIGRKKNNSSEGTTSKEKSPPDAQSLEATERVAEHPEPDSSTNRNTLGIRARGAIIQCRKEKPKDKKMEVDLSFVTKENRIITVEEMDEVLSVENKDKNNILKMSRDFGHASLLFQMTGKPRNGEIFMISL